ncbi:tripartite tricarboxylate transporter substrate binding protein [Comamonas humi]
MKHTTTAAALCSLLCISSWATAQPSPGAANEKWPTRPVTIIVPGPPGGSVDNPIRLLGQKLGSLIGQPVVVVNKPGSGGIIGTQSFLRAPADGYTLLAGNVGPQAINYSAYRSLPYKPGELKPLVGVISFPNVLVVNASSSDKSVADLVAELKRHPQQASFGSAGTGQTSHLMGELFKLRTGVEAVHVPYKGSAPATLALLASETRFQFDNLTQALPHIQSQKLRALAVTSEARVAALPQVPTMEEAGYKNMVSSAWVGIFVASAVPAGVASQIESAVATAMQDNELRDKLAQTGGIPSSLAGAKFAEFVQKDIDKWKEAIDSSGVKLD